MTSKLVPANPEEVMVIRDVVPNITILFVPFARGGIIKFGGRATIVKLQTGSLAVFSPVALTPSVKTKLDSLGNKVSYLIAPDLEHHIFLSAWATAYPTAHLIAPEGLAEKRAQQNGKDKSVTVLKFGTIFTKSNKREIKISEEFDQEFEYEYVEAHPNKELVFHHKPSRTLIEADVLFNLPATEQYSKSKELATAGWATKLALKLMGTQGNAKWQQRAQWYLFSSGDRKAFTESVRRINGFGFENLVPCHGDTLVGDGKGVFEKVFGWFLEGQNQRK